MAIKEITDLIKRVVRAQNGGKRNPLTKRDWDVISPEDHKDIIPNTEIIVEVMKKGSGIIFAGFGIVKSKSLLNNLTLSLSGFKQTNDNNALDFKNKNMFKKCQGKDICEFSISKKQTVDLRNQGMPIILQVYKIKGQSSDISVLLYIKNDTNRQNKIKTGIVSRTKNSIMKNKRLSKFFN